MPKAVTGCLFKYDFSYSWNSEKYVGGKFHKCQSPNQITT